MNKYYSSYNNYYWSVCPVDGGNVFNYRKNQPLTSPEVPPLFSHDPYFLAAQSESYLNEPITEERRDI